MLHPLGMETQFRYITLIEDDPLGLNTSHINAIGTTYCSMGCLLQHQRTQRNTLGLLPHQDLLLTGEAFWACCRTKIEIPWQNISSPHQASPLLFYKSDGTHRWIKGPPQTQQDLDG